MSSNEKASNQKITGRDSQPVKSRSERRSFLLKSTLVAGGAALGLVTLDKINAFSRQQQLTSLVIPTPPSSGDPTLSLDAVLAYAYLHQNGQINLLRDVDGRITQLNYGPMILTISRDSNGIMTSFTTSMSSDSITQTHTILRGPDGRISSIVVS
ncbi:MAG TPA: hypothetical protein VFF30_03840 [Nitrososphaerales archaeon]|nr:hypothetical protein [Nitrososphaerales archaeon]